MKIIIYGNDKITDELKNKIEFTLDDLGLLDFIPTEKSYDSDLKEKLNITNEPAIIIEEESIDFIDTILEGTVPNNEEIKSMIISIIGGQSSGTCDTSQCGNGCFC